MTSEPLAIQHHRAAPAGTRYQLIAEDLHECLAALATRENAELVRDLLSDLPWERIHRASPELRCALYQTVRRALDVLAVWLELPTGPTEPAREVSRRYQAALDLYNRSHRAARALAQRERDGVGSPT